jgi:hypothetical protein
MPSWDRLPALEKLNSALVLFGCLQRLESAEIFPLSLRVFLSRVETILA